MSSGQAPFRSQREGSSPESDVHESGDSVPPEPKRRVSRAGTRSVSQLSQAQLERKRANDREAQRAIRQRNKDRVETLEKQNKELEEENAVLRRCIQDAGLLLPTLSRNKGDSGSWGDLTVRGPPPLQLQAGMPMPGPQPDSQGLMPARDSQTTHHGYGFRPASQWPGPSPFGDPPSQSKSENSPSPGSPLSPQQYPPWPTPSGDRTRVPSHSDNQAIASQTLEYSGLTSGQSHPGQATAYHSGSASAAQGQAAMPLEMPPQGIAQYGPIQQPYMQQPQPQPQQQQQQRQGQNPRSGRGSSRTRPSRAAPDSHTMYYGSYQSRP